LRAPEQSKDLPCKRADLPLEQNRNRCGYEEQAMISSSVASRRGIASSHPREAGVAVVWRNAPAIVGGMPFGRTNPGGRAGSMDGIPAERTRDGCRSRQGAILAKRTQAICGSAMDHFGRTNPRSGRRQGRGMPRPCTVRAAPHFWQNEPKERAMPGPYMVRAALILGRTNPRSGQCLAMQV
jgi:hypothetical protein